jgi:hypothetical protein
LQGQLVRAALLSFATATSAQRSPVNDLWDGPPRRRPETRRPGGGPYLAAPTGGCQRRAARAPADWTSSGHPASAGRLRALLGKLLHRRTLQRRPPKVDRERRVGDGRTRPVTRDQARRLSPAGDADTVRLFTRRGYDLSGRYPAIAITAMQLRARKRAQSWAGRAWSIRSAMAARCPKDCLQAVNARMR